MERQEAVRLARTLRALRESHWPGVELTQAQLATAFSTESRVASATISTWESTSNTKSPNADRLHAYARFFATRRSLEGGPRLIPEHDLDEAEHAEFRRLEDRLLGQLGGNADERTDTLTFADGPVTIICPDAPPDIRGSFANKKNPNFTKLQQYTDLDALIEIHGHVRAANPTLDVFHCLASEAKADDMSSHVILLGGISWNEVTRRFQAAIAKMPIVQVAHPDLDTGEIFSVQRDGEDQLIQPEWEEVEEEPTQDDKPRRKRRELAEDVALVARLPNPFNISRTLTICNGVHSRGVLGAVRCLTDKRVRELNEQYLSERFPDGTFALLLRVPVVTNATLSPDLQSESNRLFEWAPEDGV